MVKLKTKIFIGLAFLLSVILLLGIAGSIFIYELANDSGKIIKDNYRSINYMTTMLRSLDQIHSLHMQTIFLEQEGSISKLSFDKPYEDALGLFDKIFELQANNITEPGERQLVKSLEESYKDYLRAFKNIADREALLNLNETYLKLNLQYEQVRNSIEKIHDMNMQAIFTKNTKAMRTADQVVLYMTVATGMSLVISLIFIFYFPGYIADPISKLTEKIKGISLGNYNQRLQLSSKDEIGELAEAFNKMASSLEEYERSNISKLLREKKRMEAIVENINEAILVLDENQNIISANKNTFEVTGINRKEQLIGKYAPDVAAQNDLVRAMIKDVTEEQSQVEGKKDYSTILNIVSDHRINYYTRETIKITTALNGGADNQEVLIGYMIVLKNVTQFEEKNIAKTNFLANVSHELKTPISSINLILRLLEDGRLGTLNEEQTKLIESIRTQTNRLSRMANELKDFSQFESGGIQIKIAEVRPEKIISYAVDALSMQLKEKDIYLETEVDAELPTIFADLEKSVWILVNIIGNAIRYTPEKGNIIIYAQRENVFVKFSVKDQGPGIAEENQRKIFDKFVQFGDHASKGWGLGLAMSKEFVQSQGGTIWVESELGQGSKFSFTLPVSKP